MCKLVTSHSSSPSHTPPPSSPSSSPLTLSHSPPPLTLHLLPHTFSSPFRTPLPLLPLSLSHPVTHIPPSSKPLDSRPCHNTKSHSYHLNRGGPFPLTCSTSPTLHSLKPPTLRSHPLPTLLSPPSHNNPALLELGLAVDHRTMEVCVSLYCMYVVKHLHMLTCGRNIDSL